MKHIARLILLMFVTFLSTPTVVSLIKKGTDVSVFYSFAEEEIHKEIKEVKAEIKSYDYPIVVLTPKKSKIIYENLSKHDNVFDEIFSPPPEFI
jgi:hypothetical protein